MCLSVSVSVIICVWVKVRYTKAIFLSICQVNFEWKWEMEETQRFSVATGLKRTSDNLNLVWPPNITTLGAWQVQTLTYGWISSYHTTARTYSKPFRLAPQSGWRGLWPICEWPILCCYTHIIVLIEHFERVFLDRGSVLARVCHMWSGASQYKGAPLFIGWCFCSLTYANILCNVWVQI